MRGLKTIRYLSSALHTSLYRSGGLYSEYGIYLASQLRYGAPALDQQPRLTACTRLVAAKAAWHFHVMVAKKVLQRMHSAAPLT